MLTAEHWIRFTNLHPRLGGDPPWDGLRMAILTLAVVEFGLTWRTIRDEPFMPWRQTCRYVWAQLLIIGVAYTSIASLGSPPTYLLLTNAVGMCFGLAGLTGPRPIDRPTKARLRTRHASRLLRAERRRREGRL